jgi:hypothetical protein
MLSIQPRSDWSHLDWSSEMGTDVRYDLSRNRLPPTQITTNDVAVPVCFSDVPWAVMSCRAVLMAKDSSPDPLVFTFTPRLLQTLIPEG